jgi:hypothetical protein
MTDQHPITPPPELVQQWIEETRSHDCIGAYPADLEQCVATRAAAWGADTELDACCEWLDRGFGDVGNFPATLRAARRPEPPKSLKEQALAALDDAIMRGDCITISDALPTIRRAIEALPE